ncbi:competence/damage-inducible protein cinA [Draconibacterium orientale]|jgi:nicotinamide-nucleotide amidase|uniref:CinA-like protein n=1 Tax=Draconibacterium orientale TaxID=1168034 RepID=X5DC25_9BACT|nr:competence/damage-inducible protein A [Draconibacterium orientale]AHW58509.1 damage-inducible protein CinA [Draconibacterium orientale]SET88087.1 competence/damage-inducible protein cinA [Draconibacterium orientale]
MKAEIITIGDEILIGQIVDTNSAWMGEQFNLNGIEIYQITSVHDDHDHIMRAIKNAEAHADLVVITGGLGPTKDDITKHTLCEYFNTKLVFHEPTLNAITERFKHRGVDMNKLNRDQAMLPESCTILPNKMGTAPGMWFEKNDTIFVSMPGVPFEMKYLVEFELLPRLRQTKRTKAIFHKTVLTQGVPESMLAERIAAWEEALPAHIKLAYLPNPMAVRLRLSAIGDRVQVLKSEVESEIEKLQKIIPEAIFGYDTETMSEVIGRELVKQNKKLAVAESCTGGYISHLITSVSGSSAYYNGSVTSYSNEIKEKLLGVSRENLEKYGAVSEQVAREMVEGVKRVMKADYAVATTGIAGPTGGTEEKPVGTVWIAVSGPEKTLVKKYTFIGDQRDRNIVRSGQTALQLLRRMVLGEL